MANRLIKLVEGEYYHIYNRGNDKRVIFHDDQDRSYFKNLLFVMNDINRIKVRDLKNEKENISDDKTTHPIAIGAYCLMPNHFHLLVKQETENGASLFMQKLSTAYAMYYNKKYKRTGGLFEGTFKSKYVSSDLYMKYLFSYIHLNPLKIINEEWNKNIEKRNDYVSFLYSYRYSSFLEYTDVSNSGILKRDSFPNYFPDKQTFLDEIFNWILIKYEQ